jgi:ribosomal protein S18 acetylase RimI-like enzyme
MRTQGITIRPASEAPLRDLVRAINAAYMDYYTPTHVTPESFERLVEWESVHLDKSAAVMEGRKIIGMGLLGVRGQRGWISAVGILPRYRGHGIGRQLMNYLIDQARLAGVDTVQLEVITQNERAYRLYRSLGFQTLRRLLILVWSEGPMPFPSPDLDPELTIGPEAVHSLVEDMQPLITVRRPWRRERESLDATRQHLLGLAARDGRGSLLGACIYRVEGFQAGILDIAAATVEAGDYLLANLLRRGVVSHVSYVNLTDDDPLLPIFQDAGFQETLSQYEMILHLTPEASA